MKLYFQITLFFVSFSLVAQRWETQTRQADSLAFEREFDSSYANRTLALASAKALKLSPDTIEMLSILERIGFYETQLFTAPKLAFDSVVSYTNSLEKFKLQRGLELSQDYRKVYIYAYNVMRDLNSTLYWCEKSLELQESDSVHPASLANGYLTAGTIGMKLGDFVKAAEHLDKVVAQFSPTADLDSSILGVAYYQKANIYHAHNLDVPSKKYKYLSLAEEALDKARKPLVSYQTNVYYALADHAKLEGDFETSERYLKKSIVFDEAHSALRDFQEMHSDKYGTYLQYYRTMLEIYAKADKTNQLRMTLAELREFEKAKLNPDEIEVIKDGYLEAIDFYKTKEDRYCIELLKSLERYIQNVAPDQDKWQNQIKLEKLMVDIDFGSDLNHLESASKAINPNELTDSYLKNRWLETQLHLHFLNKRADSVKALTENMLSTIMFDVETFFSTTHYDIPSFRNDIQHSKILTKLGDIHQKYGEKVKASKLYWLALCDRSEKNYGKSFSVYTKRQIDQLTRKLFETWSPLRDDDHRHFIQLSERLESGQLVQEHYLRRQTDDISILSNLSDERKLTYKLIALERKNSQVKSDSINELIFDLSQQLAKHKNNRQTLHFSNAADVNQHTYNDSTQLILKYFELDSMMYRWTLSSNQIDFKPIGSSGQIETLVFGALEQIKTQKKNTYLEDLSRMLLPEKLSNKLLIIPHSSLSRFPFELLLSEGQTLIEDTEITYSHSLFLKTKRYNELINNNLLCYSPQYNKDLISENQLALRGGAYDLPGTALEIENISKLIPNRWIKDTKATKSNFIQQCDSFSILHLALHAVLDASNPKLSGLVFSDVEDDNILSVSEIMSLNIPAELVVLSACNTSTNQKGSHGLNSISRSFYFAGAKSTVGSLWSVPDKATQNFMVLFYTHLKEQASVSKSLQLAKQDFRIKYKDSEWAHPFYWAGFINYGEAKLELKTNTQQHWFWISGALLMLLVIGYFIKTKV